MTMRPKEWLVANGHLPKGSENKRGRISLAHDALCVAAAAAGADILGYTRKGAASTVEPPPVVKSKAAAPATAVADIGEPRYPERDWQAFVGTQEVGMRTVCDNCHNSMTYCLDGSPAIMYDGKRAVVTLKPRNDPNYRPRWW